jgi:hypothetical protein
MECPDGVPHRKRQVMALYRYIYGLKQASRRWFDKLRKILVAAGYKPTRSDPCLYRRLHNGEETLIAVVVDDILIASTTSRGTSRVIAELRAANLQTKDLGEPEYVIGMHVQRHANGDISLSQRLYIETLLRRFNMTDANPVDTPANSSVKLSKKLCPTDDDERSKMKGKPYRQIVGALLYVLLTRPDCAVAINELARFTNDPGAAMWTAAKRVLKYLKGTMDRVLVFKHGRQTPKHQLVSAYVDSSHADDPDERRSRCGHVVLYNDSPIHWRTILQKRRALSTAEAEYRAATYAAKDVLWLRNLLSEIGRKQNEPTTMHEDNAACIKMTENPIISARNKFIELDCHFIRDHHKLGNIRLKKIDSESQTADIMTKKLAATTFKRHRNSLTRKLRNQGSRHQSTGD